MSVLNLRIMEKTSPEESQRLLVLEDDPVLLRHLDEALASRAREGRPCGNPTRAMQPLSLDTLGAALAEVLKQPRELRTQVRLLVGRRPVHEVEHEVRTTMVHEAMARSEGSVRGAARLLGVSRQLLQHMLRRLRDTSTSQVHVFPMHGAEKTGRQ